MSAVISISTGKSYGVSRVCRVWGLSRASVYRNLQPVPSELPMRRRPGPQGSMSDADLVDAIRRVITDSPFYGEGHRKVWARLRYKGIRTSKARVLRLMRENGLCAKPCHGASHGPRAHDGTVTFTREEWQQAQRAGLDAKELKAVFKKLWESSDNRAAFEQALKERGFWLAKGDRRGFVAVDYRGEVYAVARYSGVKAKDEKAKLGDPQTLRSVDEIKAEIAGGMTARLQEFIRQAERDAARRSLQIDFRKAEIVGRHREERRALTEAHETRWQAETRKRAERLPKGFSGIWHRLTGKYAKVRAQNEREALECVKAESQTACNQCSLPATRSPVSSRCRTPPSVSRARMCSTTRPILFAAPRVQLVTLAAHKLVAPKRSRRSWQTRSSGISC